MARSTSPPSTEVRNRYIYMCVCTVCRCLILSTTSLSLLPAGNIIKPSDASNTPAVGFELPPHLFENESGGSPEDSLWTLVMTNPDGHFVDENAEYLHWMVGAGGRTMGRKKKSP